MRYFNYFEKFTPESKVVKYITTYYADNNNYDLADAAGITYAQVKYIATKFKLHKSSTYELHYKRKNIAKTRTPEALAKHAKAMKRVWATAYAFHLSGMKHSCGFKLSKYRCKKDMFAINNLKYKYNYFRTDNPYILGYDAETRRTINEQYFINKYNIQFVEAEE